MTTFERLESLTAYVTICRRGTSGTRRAEFDLILERLQEAIAELPDPAPILPEGDVDHDDDDRRAYREELNERPKPSEY